MVKKLASVATAGVLALGIAAPVPAFANTTETGSAHSSQTILEDPVGELESFAYLSTVFPLLLSSVALSVIGVPQCGLHDTRGCHRDA